MASRLEVQLRWLKMMQALALEVAKARVAKEMTPTKLAEAAGVEEAFIHRIEDGRGDVDLGVLVKIAKALGMVVDVKFKSGK